MQRLALEMHFSETTFVQSETPRDGGFDVRIFTPAEEVPFAGHPTLGTAHIIRHEILRGGAGPINLNLKIGRIPVTFEAAPPAETVYWMQQIEPEFRETLSPAVLAPILGLVAGDLDARYPIEEVSTGLPHIIVPLRTLDALKRARVNRELYFAQMEGRWAQAILVFCPEPHEPQNDLAVRMFADCFGITEDPATGSGNGCLAGYLARHRYGGRATVDLRSEQGYEILRPSLLHLRAEDKDGHIRIAVGGKAITIAKGEFV